MKANKDTGDEMVPRMEDPNAELEIMYIEDYLRAFGLSLHDLNFMDEDLRRTYMTAACRFASIRLAEVEHWAQSIHSLHFKA